MNDRHPLYAALAALLLAAPSVAWAGGDRVSMLRSNGRAAWVNLVDAATQSSGFLNAMRDSVAGTTWLDFAWATPVAGDPRHVILVQGAGEVERAAFDVRQDGATLNVVTPFETLRCLVDVEDGSFDCEPGPALAFDLTWTRDGFETTWEQRVSDYRMGPLRVRQQGQFEQRSATVAGSFGGLPASGAAGTLLDSKGVSLTREVRIRVAP